MDINRRATRIPMGATRIRGRRTDWAQVHTRARLGEELPNAEEGGVQLRVALQLALQAAVLGPCQALDRGRRPATGPGQRPRWRLRPVASGHAPHGPAQRPGEPVGGDAPAGWRACERGGLGLAAEVTMRAATSRTRPAAAGLRDRQGCGRSRRRTRRRWYRAWRSGPPLVVRWPGGGHCAAARAAAAAAASMRRRRRRGRRRRGEAAPARRPEPPPLSPPLWRRSHSPGAAPTRP